MDKANLKSILIIVVGFCILSYFTGYNWPIYIAILVGLTSIISNRAAGLINKVWFGLAKILGYINSRILLTLIYYLFLLPLALISRLSRKKTIILRKNKTTYFSERDYQYNKADFENPW